MAVSGVDKECAGAMEVMLKETLTVVNEMEVDLKVGTDLREKFGGELFGVLCSVTSGEANMIVRSVVGKGVGYCGFTALYLLGQRFNPKTPAKLLQCVLEVVRSGKMRDIRSVTKGIEQWEAKKARLKVEPRKK